MATISMKKAAPISEATKTETPPVAEAPKQEVLPPQYRNNQIEGEMTSRDFLIPYLSLGQKTGSYVDEHPEWIGGWIYDKSVFLGKPIKVIVFRLVKRYEEDLPFGSEEIPRRYTKMEDARNDGAEVRDVGDIDLLVETENKELFPFTQFLHEGKGYLTARYTVRSTAYGAAFKLVYRDSFGWLKGDLVSGYYQLGSEKKTSTKGSWHVPQFKADGKVGDKLRAAIHERFES